MPNTSRLPRPTAAATAATPSAFVQAIALAYARRALSPEGALSRAQIAPSVLSDPQARITTGQMEALSDAAMRELEDEALGAFHRRLPWGSYGLLARASLTAPNLGVALKRWCRHHALLTDDLHLALHLAPHFPVHPPPQPAFTPAAAPRFGPTAAAAHTVADGPLAVPPGAASLTLTEAVTPPWADEPQAALIREFVHVSLLRNLLGLACWLVDSRLPLAGVELAYPAPAHREAYRVLFAGPCRFDAPQTRLHLDARDLALPIRRDEASLRQMLQHALPLTVRPYRRDRRLVQRVRQLLASEPQTGRSAQVLAQRLNTSARSLHRQLKEEGANLQALKDEVRREQAQNALRRTQRPIKQIAQAAGFDNEKSFSRAFKSWTGASPSVFRRGSGGS